MIVIERLIKTLRYLWLMRQCGIAREKLDDAEVAFISAAVSTSTDPMECAKVLPSRVAVVEADKRYVRAYQKMMDARKEVEAMK